MKIHFLQNWFKLMLGTSALIVSVAFLIRSISPAYATNTLPVNVANYNGIVEGGNIFFISNGYMYKVKLGQMDRAFKYEFRMGAKDGIYSANCWGVSSHPIFKGEMIIADGLPVWWEYFKMPSISP